MTVREFSNEFDILYDSIASIGAPGVDEYEKSVFLTDAQLQIIKEYFGPVNKYKTSFEGSSKRRVDLRELILSYEIETTKITNGLTSDYSYNAIIPEDTFLLVYEASVYKDTTCNKEVRIGITPIKYDEITDALRNPFRRPSDSKGLRIDIASKNGNKIVELISNKPIHTYQIRYIKYPTPIVLTDLSGISSGTGLTIDGVNTKTECTLDKEIHREILDRAVEMAMLAYKKESLVAQVQLDQRNN